jgi:hypothetical protein
MAYTVVDKGSKYFNTVTWTGDGTSSKPITGVGFKPDFVWMKSRSSAGTNHHVFDSVRVVSSTPQRLFPNLTNAEDGNFGTLNSFDTDGFTLGNNTSGNQSTVTFVGWNLLASNTSGSSNTAGSISSTVSANTTSGFSIVSYTGNGTASTIGHGLGATPKMIITKKRSSTSNWAVYHASLLASQDIRLNLTDAVRTSNGSWNGTRPTSTVFSVQDDDATNLNGATYIGYCFAEVKGFSKFSSFVGNGSTDGAFVYTGFKPAFVMIKASSVGGTGYNWGVWDNKRLGYNADNNDLRANLSNAEPTDDSIDLLSNGFKMRTDSGGFGGGSGITYIYMAFAESPFVSSKGVCTTAR